MHYTSKLTSQSFEIEDIIRKITRFNLAISDKRYSSFIRIPDEALDSMINFSLSITEAFEAEPEDKTRLNVLRRNVAELVNGGLFKTLSYLNYLSSLKTEKHLLNQYKAELTNAFNLLRNKFIEQTEAINGDLSRIGYTDSQINTLGAYYVR